MLPTSVGYLCGYLEEIVIPDVSVSFRHGVVWKTFPCDGFQWSDSWSGTKRLGSCAIDGCQELAPASTLTSVNTRKEHYSAPSSSLNHEVVSCGERRFSLSMLVKLSPHDQISFRSSAAWIARREGAYLRQLKVPSKINELSGVRQHCESAKKRDLFVYEETCEEEEEEGEEKRRRG